MLIFCTQDNALINAWNGNTDWGTRHALTPNQTQRQAEIELDDFLGTLQPQEPLCLAGHGNDRSFGDAVGGWTWGYQRMALHLFAAGGGAWKGLPAVTNNRNAFVLFQTCAQTMANFATGVAAAADGLQSNRQYFMWIFSYKNSVPLSDPIPRPDVVYNNTPWLQCANSPRRY